MVYTDRRILMSCSHYSYYMWAVVQTEGGLLKASPLSVAVDFSDPTHHQIPHTHSVNMFTDTFPILNQCTHCIQKASLNNFS